MTKVEYRAVHMTVNLPDNQEAHYAFDKAHSLEVKVINVLKKHPDCTSMVISFVVKANQAHEVK